MLWLMVGGRFHPTEQYYEHFVRSFTKSHTFPRLFHGAVSARRENKSRVRIATFSKVYFGIKTWFFVIINYQIPILLVEKLKQTPDILIVMIFEILHEKLKRIRLVLFIHLFIHRFKRKKLVFFSSSLGQSEGAFEHLINTL